MMVSSARTGTIGVASLVPLWMLRTAWCYVVVRAVGCRRTVAVITRAMIVAVVARTVVSVVMLSARAVVIAVVARTLS